MVTIQRDNRIREEKREDALKSLCWDQMQMANLQSEERADDRRIIRRMQIEKKEQEMEEAIVKVLIKLLQLYPVSKVIPHERDV